MEKLFSLTEKTNVITSVIGIVAFFTGAYWLLYICAGLSVLHSLLNMQYGGQTNFVTEIVAIVVGLIVALIRGRFALPYCAVALCIWDVVLLIPAAVMLITALVGSRKE